MPAIVSVSYTHLDVYKRQVYTLVSGIVPDFSLIVLVGMCLMAVMGSVVGRKLSKRMDSSTIDRLYVFALLLIIAISLYNFARFAIL